jgi:hypothetical protein
MRKESALQLIGIAIFIIVTSLTYGVVTPVNNTISNNSLVAVTNHITNTTNITNATNTTSTTSTTSTTNTTDDTSRLANNYHIITAIAVGGVMAIVIVFLIGFW